MFADYVTLDIKMLRDIHGLTLINLLGYLSSTRYSSGGGLSSNIKGDGRLP